MFNYKKVFILFSLFFLTFSVYSLKFKIKNKDATDDIITIESIFDTGFSAQAVADGLGVTDYESFFFKPAFHIEDFGIGLVFDFRFRLFTGDITFRSEDWYIQGDALNSFLLYIDKIDYIKYGDFVSPIYLHTGKNPVLTLGTGFLVNNFHNHAFLPTSRENGFVFKFNGNYLQKYKATNIPVDLTFVVNDLLDPDIFLLDLGTDVMQFTKFKDKDLFTFRVGQIAAVDINTTEANRLSSLSGDEEDITSHRNLTTSTDNLYTSFPLFLSYYGDFTWKHKLVKVKGFAESTFLLDIKPASDFNFGFGIKLGSEARFVNLEKSGYLVGIHAGVLLDSPHYSLNYFSSNYEVVRTKQYLGLKPVTDADYTFYVMGGFGLYAFFEKIKFNLTFYIPIKTQLYLKFSSSFILEDTLVKGLYAGVYYETGVNPASVYGWELLTNDFRFSVEAGYKFYGAKLAVLIGIQRPAWVVSDYSNSETYSRELERFVSLHISFVL